MKQFFIFCVIAISFAFASQAQVSISAILIHGDEITTFQSSDALSKAIAQAVDDDIINLSAGSFIATDITKNLTIRGTGMMPGENTTVINGNFSINIPKSGNFTLEGIYIPGQITFGQSSNVNIMKTWIGAISTDQKKDSQIESIRFIHCLISGPCSFSNKAVINSQFVNTYVKSFSGADNPASASFTNCVVESSNSPSQVSFSNSVLLSHTGTAACFNCVSNGYRFIGQPVSAGNKYMPEVTSFFKEDSETYELLDEYANTLLGNDGSQVGIHGGSLPFDPTTSSLKITKFNIGQRTTEDGMLPVEIQVETN